MQIGELTRGGSPDLSPERDHIKIKDYMDKRVTSPAWGPPPPRKHALRLAKQRLCTCITVFCTFLCRHCTTTT